MASEPSGRMSLGHCHHTYKISVSDVQWFPVIQGSLRGLSFCKAKVNRSEAMSRLTGTFMLFSHCHPQSYWKSLLSLLLSSSVFLLVTQKPDISCCSSGSFFAQTLLTAIILLCLLTCNPKPCSVLLFATKDHVFTLSIRITTTPMSMPNLINCSCLVIKLFCRDHHVQYTTIMWGTGPGGLASPIHSTFWRCKTKRHSPRRIPFEKLEIDANLTPVRVSLKLNVYPLILIAWWKSCRGPD